MHKTSRRKRFWRRGVPWTAARPATKSSGWRALRPTRRRIICAARGCGGGDEVLALEGAPPGSDPEQRVLDALSEETLTQMILNLREPYKTPCRLMLLEQHTAAEAARLCGRPQKTVEAQIYRAKKMLAEKIRQERRSEDGIVS